MIEWNASILSTYSAITNTVFWFSKIQCNSLFTSTTTAIPLTAIPNIFCGFLDICYSDAPLYCVKCFLVTLWWIESIKLDFVGSIWPRLIHQSLPKCLRWNVAQDTGELESGLQNQSEWPSHRWVLTSEFSRYSSELQIMEGGAPWLATILPVLWPLVL